MQGVQHNEDLNWMNKNDRRKKYVVTTLETTNVVNKSRKLLPRAEVEVSAKGQKFVPPPKSIRPIGMKTNAECSLSLASETVKRAAISTIAMFMKKWRNPKNDSMNKEERNAMKQFKEMNDITIVPTDNGHR